MPDTKIQRENMQTYDESQGGAFKTAAHLADFGAKQNAVNEALAEAVNALLSRVAELEEKQRRTEDELTWLRTRLSQAEERERHTADLMKRLAEEMSAHKKEVDRVRLAEKLNSGAIERLDRAVRVTGERK